MHAATGELIRHLTIDPTRDYQPPKSRADVHEKSPEPKHRFRALRMSCNLTWSGRRESNPLS
jgi:hypothetical protein